MMKWEYAKVVRTFHNGKPKNWIEVMRQKERLPVGEESSDISKAMAQLGLEGWELVTLIKSDEVVETLDPTHAIQVKATEYYFKRPLP